MAETLRTPLTEERKSQLVGVISGIANRCEDLGEGYPDAFVWVFGPEVCQICDILGEDLLIPPVRRFLENPDVVFRMLHKNYFLSEEPEVRLRAALIMASTALWGVVRGGRIVNDRVVMRGR